MPRAPTIDEFKDFTLKSYVSLLQYLSQIYKIVPFCEAPRKDTPYLILRHDIDWSLNAALKMAQIERNLGIKSTYFVLFSCSSYSVLEGNDAHVLKEISKLGHEIGLHFYPRQYQSYNRSPNKTLQLEVQLLENILGSKVYSIARHGPWDRDPFASIKGYINANHPFWRSDLYIHDSCRAWTPLEDLIKLLRTHPKRAQLLTHPENWQDDKIDRETLLERLIQCSQIENPVLKQKAKETWLTDPLVLKYDRSINNENLMRYYDREYSSDPKSKNNLTKDLEYYTRLIGWHLVNSSTGWRCHQVLNKIRDLLRIKRE